MKATITIVLEGNPITLSDGSVMPPVVVTRDQGMTSAKMPLELFMNRYYSDMADCMYPLSQSIFEELPAEEVLAVRRAEEVISRKKIEAEQAAQQEVARANVAKVKAEDEDEAAAAEAAKNKESETKDGEKKKE